MNNNETREPDNISLCGGNDMVKRWIPEHLSTQIYRRLRDIYPYEKKILGKHPVKVTEMEGMYIIHLYDDRGYMQDISIITHQLIAQNMTRQPLVHAFLRLMREALDMQDRLRNGERR
jgi:hypothetical protein